MTTEELKSKILEKCEEVLNDDPSPADLVKLAKIHGELTQRDWVESMCKSMNSTWNSCAGEVSQPTFTGTGETITVSC